MTNVVTDRTRPERNLSLCDLKSGRMFTPMDGDGCDPHMVLIASPGLGQAADGIAVVRLKDGTVCYMGNVKTVKTLNLVEIEHEGK